MTILRTQKALIDAEMADLIETYNAMTGKSIKKFESRAIAEQKTKMAIMSAEHAASQFSVKKGAKVVPMTKAEIDAKLAGQPVADEANPHKPGTMAFDLWLAGRDASAAKATSPRRRFGEVRARSEGDSKPREGSVRNAVLSIVAKTKKKDGWITVDEVTAALSQATGDETADARPHLQKLAAANWIEVRE